MKEPRTIRIPADSDLAEVLKSAGNTGAAVMIDTGEGVFPVFVGGSIHPSVEDVKVSQEGIRRSAGAWQGLVDADGLKAYVRERRRTANRPDVRL